MRLVSSLFAFGLLCVGTGLGYAQASTTYPLEWNDHDSLVVSITYSDTSPMSSAELACVHTAYRATADLIVIGEVTGMRRVDDNGCPVSSRMIGGPWVYDLTFIKAPLLSRDGSRLLSWQMEHGPNGSTTRPWVTIHTLDTTPRVINGQRVIAFADIDGPLPEFWGNFEELPDSLQGAQ